MNERKRGNDHSKSFPLFLCPGPIRTNCPTEEAKNTKRSENPTQKLMREKDIDTETQLDNPHQEPDGPK